MRRDYVGLWSPAIGAEGGLLPMVPVLAALPSPGAFPWATTLSVLVLDLTPPEEHGRASAALQLADVLGSVLGIAAATAIYGALSVEAEQTAYVVIWAALAGVAATAVFTGSRCAQRARA